MNNENSIPVKIQVTFVTQTGPLYWSRGGVVQSTALIRVLKLGICRRDCYFRSSHLNLEIEKKVRKFGPPFFENHVCDTYHVCYNMVVPSGIELCLYRSINRLIIAYVLRTPMSL